MDILTAMEGQGLGVGGKTVAPGFRDLQRTGLRSWLKTFRFRALSGGDIRDSKTPEKAVAGAVVRAGRLGGLTMARDSTGTSQKQ